MNFFFPLQSADIKNWSAEILSFLTGRSNAIMGLSSSIFFYILILCFFLNTVSSADLINSNETLPDGRILVSSNQRFVLGFFTPAASSTSTSTINTRYLGIWYKSSPQVVVWVANRETPLTDSNGVLLTSVDGNLALINGVNQIAWSTNYSIPVEQEGSVAVAVAQLLDSGNFVVRRIGDKDTQSYIWQSFDFPTNTLLPGMKLGFNSSVGRTWSLGSWKNQTDPSSGEFTFSMDSKFGLPRFVLLKGSVKRYQSGGWNGIRFSGTNALSNSILTSTIVYDNQGSYYSYEWADNSSTSRLVLTESGSIERYLQNEGSSDWSLMYAVPKDLCDDYGRCGPNGICRISKTPICECLESFVPRSLREWDMLNWSSGCARKIPADCENNREDDEFLRVKNVKLPDLTEFQLRHYESLEECKTRCLMNCSCTAYAYSDITGGRTGDGGCSMWYGDLIDLREFIPDQSEQDIYIRMPVSESGNRKNKSLVLTLLASIIPSMVVVLVLGIWWWVFQRRRKKKVRGFETEKEDTELPVFQLSVVVAATKNFSLSNRIGEGGFGPVYKGQLSSNGQEIAVKRLSKNSGQGIRELKNEVILISKLQHRNLVKLLGCCLDGGERMLIYEYMPNGSLDYFIFDQDRSRLLPWKNRFEIALGTARGLLYLHQDSRLRIIHRDLKASNILLDSELKPKISDFGIAKTVGGDQIEGKTKRVIGTYGYMSPEYAFNGEYSVKSDVFSLGVLLLELVSGRKNRIFEYSDKQQSLLGYAWLLWNESKAMQLMDECLEGSFDESQMLRCIHVGLLCVQNHPDDRPMMAEVVFMLSSERAQLAQPKHPGFFMESNSHQIGESNVEESIIHHENNMTMTLLEAR